MPPRRTPPKQDRALRALLEAYLDDGGAQPPPDRHFEASQQLEDLAMHDPEAFWQFLLLLLEHDRGLTSLVGLGVALTWLLRWHPDDFDERVAGLASRDQQMRDIVTGLDFERIAPDVRARLDAALSGPLSS